ncbi:hypothetical protein HanRHA438_Chr17g0827181 [Helianthus annuus]|nr:hypothetical protein HanRHA438_Chr17g0827181 [Helianthus annuus]
MKSIDLSFSLISIRFPSCFFGQSILGWNHNSGIRAVVIPPDMVAHALSEAEFYQWMSESLVKLESQLQTVFNEFRSFRTAWEAQSPTLPQPVSYTAPCVPSPASAATPSPTSPPPKKVPITAKSASKLTPTPSTKYVVRNSTLASPMILQSSTKHDPKNSSRTSFGLFLAKYGPTRQRISSNAFFGYHVTRVLNNFVDDQPSVQYSTFCSMSSKEADLKDPSRDDLFNIISATGKREWHPPWRPIEMAPNATNRIEWRPPWSLFLSLRTRTLSTGRECYVPTNSIHLPVVVKFYFSM